MKIKRLRRQETPRIVGDDSARSEPTEVADSNNFKPLLKEKRLKEQTGGGTYVKEFGANHSSNVGTRKVFPPNFGRKVFPFLSFNEITQEHSVKESLDTTGETSSEDVVLKPFNSGTVDVDNLQWPLAYQHIHVHVIAAI
ncbi:hypothetical protein Tco_0826252 [Tanacetum coccineum]